MVVGTSQSSQAAEESQELNAPAGNEVQPIELGVKPQITSPGGVLVVKARCAYLTFNATQSQYNFTHRCD